VRVVLTTLVELGDEGDTADVASDVHVDAGPGDDVLTMHAGRGSVALGDGADSTIADAGEWSVDGGPGPDVIATSGSAKVGAGYAMEPGAVFVSLDGQANDGEAGEGDNVGPGVARVVGSDFDDVLDARGAGGVVELYGYAGNDVMDASPAGGFLIGGDGNDLLRGGPGNDGLGGEAGDDQLFGAGGDDHLAGEAGSNLVDGGLGSDAYAINGSGQDVVHARDAAVDTVQCSTFARHLDVDAIDRLTDCAPLIVPARRPRVRLDRHRRLRFTVRCARQTRERCQGTVRLTDGGPHALGSTRFSIPSGRHGRISMRLRRRPRARSSVRAIFRTHRTRVPPSQRETVLTLRLDSAGS
jgi:hypothetical protein